MCVCVDICKFISRHVATPSASVPTPEHGATLRSAEQIEPLLCVTVHNTRSFASDINCISLPASVSLFSFPPRPCSRPLYLRGGVGVGLGGAGGKGAENKKTNLKEGKSQRFLSFFCAFVCLQHVGWIGGVTHQRGNQLCLVEWRLNSMHSGSRRQSQKYVGNQDHLLSPSEPSLLANTKCFCQTLFLQAP